MTTHKYFEGLGRRKTAIARVRMTPATSASFTVNDKSLNDYFKVGELQNVASEAITKSKLGEKFAVSVKVVGGGVSSQAGAVRHGVARALLIYDINLRKDLKKAGYLKRDPRAKERRKFGLKKARKSAQWSKR
ncbi:MAG: 30S ribosomal protein S9 [Minisyncoccia bacterium]